MPEWKCPTGLPNRKSGVMHRYLFVLHIWGKNYAIFMILFEFLLYLIFHCINYAVCWLIAGEEIEITC